MRRRLLLAATAASLASPAFATARRPLAAMTEGPFYPPAAWRAGWADWDADLTRVQRGGQTRLARGSALGLQLAALDTEGRVLDGAEVEIWQCDALAQYRHPGVPQAPGRFDEGFQGYGAARTTRDGTVQFRTIRPVPYPGRTPHIHVTLRHASFGERSSQLFVAGEPGNERDFLWRRLDAADRDALAMRLQPAPAGSGLAYTVRHALVVPA